MIKTISDLLYKYAKELNFEYNNEKVYISNNRLLDVEPPIDYNKDVLINIYKVGGTDPTSSFGKDNQFESELFEIAVRVNSNISISECENILRKFTKKILNFDNDEYNIITIRLSSDIATFEYDDKERTVMSCYVVIELNEYYDKF